VSDNGLHALVGLTVLTSLDLRDRKVSEEGLLLLIGLISNLDFKRFMQHR
jgi:hypothetical protein